MLQQILIAGWVGAALSTGAMAQQTPPAGAPGTACKSARAEPATKPAPASADGTAPGNAGSTGWSGGLGGSTIGTSQNGGTPNATTVQPATARGLDPIAAAPKPAPSAC